MRLLLLIYQGVSQKAKEDRFYPFITTFRIPISAENSSHRRLSGLFATLTWVHGQFILFWAQNSLPPLRFGILLGIKRHTLIYSGIKIL